VSADDALFSNLPERQVVWCETTEHARATDALELRLDDANAGPF
jgi:hypothetical protein